MRKIHQELDQGEVGRKMFKSTAKGDGLLD